MKILKALCLISIFFLSFAFLFTAGSAGVGAYLFINQKSDISRCEESAKNIAETLTGACAQISEMGKPEERAARLKSFFSESRGKKLFRSAFLVASDGRIIAHSNDEEAKALNLNIANDEFKYNLDMIFRPVKDGSESVFVSDYNISGETIPFSRVETHYIKKYLYAGIDRNGWLAAKAVREKGRPYGSVCFIIAKDEIHASIRENINYLKKALKITAIASFAAALVIFVLAAAATAANAKNGQASIKFRGADEKPTPENEYPEDERGTLIFEESENRRIPESDIQDAIPIKKRR